MRSARRAATVAFWIYGCILASWVSRIPTIKHRLGLSTGGLGVALIGAPIGLIVAMHFAARLIERRSSAFAMRTAAAGACLSLVSLAVAPGQVGLLALLVPFGLCLGTFDVAMNTQGVSVERGYDRPIMSALHGSYSIGVMTGALGGSLAARAGLAPVAHFAIAAAVLLGVNLFATPDLLVAIPPRPARGVTRADGGGHAGASEHSSGSSARMMLALLGLIAFACFFAEGAVDDWSGVYLHEARHASLAVAPLGAGAAAAGMTIGRLAGDPVIARVGRWSMLGRAALVAAIGMAVAVVAPSAAVAIAGYACLGLGVATIVPIVFSLAGNVAAVAPATALSRVTTLGYAGLFGSPTVIGLLAHGVGLRAALWLPAVLLIAIILLSLKASRLREA